MKAAPRIIGYIRVSTSDQAESGLGLEAQEKRIRAACEYKGWDLVDVIRDEGITGTSVAKRAGLKRALRTIAKRQADGLVVTKLDRLSRSSADTALLFEWFQEARARLAILDHGDGELDTSTAMGAAVLGFMAVMAQLESGQTSERTRAALAVKRQRGERVGRPGVHEIPALQQRIERLRREGTKAEPGAWTWQRIADQLNKEEVPTLRGGKLWRVSAVQTAGGYIRPPARKKRTALPRPR